MKFSIQFAADFSKVLASLGSNLAKLESTAVLKSEHSKTGED